MPLFARIVLSKDIERGRPVHFTPVRANRGQVFEDIDDYMITRAIGYENQNVIGGHYMTLVQFFDDKDTLLGEAFITRTNG